MGPDLEIKALAMGRVKGALSIDPNPILNFSAFRKQAFYAIHSHFSDTGGRLCWPVTISRGLEAHF